MAAPIPDAEGIFDGAKRRKIPYHSYGINTPYRASNQACIIHATTPKTNRRLNSKVLINRRLPANCRTRCARTEVRPPRAPRMNKKAGLAVHRERSVGEPQPCQMSRPYRKVSGLELKQKARAASRAKSVRCSVMPMVMLQLCLPAPIHAQEVVEPRPPSGLHILSSDSAAPAN